MTVSIVNIHASCVVLEGAGQGLGAPYDAGVLILGESGAGKSDLALRLIAMGARLVADDRCDLSVTSGSLCAAVPLALAGMIEIRGVGIVRVPYQPKARIALAVRLSHPAAVRRLPESTSYCPPSPLELPEPRRPREIMLAPFEASAPAKILAAAAEFARR
ncbi:MAG TPA: HPr kinase/phosphatase C-terminal domain-containing protein [Rhizomicrobium sp.]|nr:HPr kinase/phosphatase C-terminal domain-containing protein [Rhizomicrobium sp.]